jgi:hypothetical protein
VSRGCGTANVLRSSKKTTWKPDPQTATGLDQLVFRSSMNFEDTRGSAPGKSEASFRHLLEGLRQAMEAFNQNNRISVSKFEPGPTKQTRSDTNLTTPSSTGLG